MPALQQHGAEVVQQINALADALRSDDVPDSLSEDVKNIGEELDMLLNDPALREVER